jgi:GNAT superfamily N-acetyltransferase
LVRHGYLRQPREGRAPSGPPQGLVDLRRVDVVRTYLALDDPARFRGSRTTAATERARLVRHSPCPVDLYRRLYKEVGEQWYWHDRLEWSDEELATHLAKPNVSVWEVRAGRNESAGFFELQRAHDGSVEIVYFGLIPKFFGQGLGGWLLERAVDFAWAMGARRVWLHTCTLDAPSALPNYVARGFEAYKTERLEVELEGMTVVGERLLHE